MDLEKFARFQKNKTKKKQNKKKQNKFEFHGS
jgi:hypothetical protein